MNSKPLTNKGTIDEQIDGLFIFIDNCNSLIDGYLKKNNIDLNDEQSDDKLNSIASIKSSCTILNELLTKSKTQEEKRMTIVSAVQIINEEQIQQNLNLLTRES